MKTRPDLQGSAARRAAQPGQPAPGCRFHPRCPQSMFFQLTYTWRTFFLIYAHEDYVDVARAKGLPPRQIERQYILRPTLPYILTSFSLILVSFWQTSMALEVFFFWPGIGILYLHNLRVWAYNPNVVMGIVTLFAYILALTVLVLDIVYVLVDPRVSIEAPKQGRQVRAFKDQLGEFFSGFWRPRRSPALSMIPNGASPARKVAAFSKWTAQVQPALREITRRPWALAGFLISLLLLAASLWAYANNPAVVTGVAASLAYILALTLLVLFFVFPLAESRVRSLSPAKRVHKTSWWTSQFRPALREIARYPSAVIGILSILFMLGLSIYTVITIPYDQIRTVWVSDIWTKTPKNAAPAWTNLFRTKKLPVTFDLNSQDGSAQKTVKAASPTSTDIQLSYGFDFPYDDFPQEIIVEFDAVYDQKRPHVSMAWFTPDGREIDLGTVSITSSTNVYFPRTARSSAG
jgi:hypothetical protein